MKLSPAIRRRVRTVHLWIGAWGALAAVLFGVSELLQNHRALLRLPQGETTEIVALRVPVPEEARVSPGALGAWLWCTQHLQLQLQQRDGMHDSRWILTGGNARITYQVQYLPGQQALMLRTIRRSPLAVLSRLTSDVYGSVAWVLLSDSFAVGLALLGFSGIALWARGRSARQRLFGTVGVAAMLLVIVGGSALI